MRRRVAITGAGIITAHGAGYGKNLSAFMEGKDSIREISLFDATRYRGKKGGEVPEFSFGIKLQKLKKRRLDRATLLLLTAFEEAREASGLSFDGIEALVSLGTTLGGMISGVRYHTDYVKKGRMLSRPSMLTDYLAHFQAAHLKEEYGIEGEAATFSDACASSSNSIGYAFESIRGGLADVAIAGGYEPMCEFTLAGFNSLQAITPSVCRPFDKNRDGLVLGEGAAVLILEELEKAKTRGARILGEVIGFGASSDAYHSTRPDPDAKGAIAAVKAALEDAGIMSSDIDYINAHGTATPFNDQMEARAITDVFDKGVPVSSVKSMVGHMLGASGATEAIVSLMAIREGFLPPNINLTEPDPECAVNIVREQVRGVSINRVLSTSFGFGGANAALVLQKYKQ